MAALMAVLDWQPPGHRFSPEIGRGGVHGRTHRQIAVQTVTKVMPDRANERRLNFRKKTF
jgi:hypothetical protein